MTNAYPKLHVAISFRAFEKKGMDRNEVTASVENMLKLIAWARSGDQKFDGVDILMGQNHMRDSDVQRLGDSIRERGLDVGAIIAPSVRRLVEKKESIPAIHCGLQKEYIRAVMRAQGFAEVLNERGVRRPGLLRINSLLGASSYTWGEVTRIASAHGERLAAHTRDVSASWESVANLLEEVDSQGAFGLHVSTGHFPRCSTEESSEVYITMAERLRPWTVDFHIGQHEETCDINMTAGHWLKGAQERGIDHISLDQFALPNANPEDRCAWNAMLTNMVKIREAHGWNIEPPLPVKK